MSIQIWNLQIHWISKPIGRKIGAIFQNIKEVIVPQIGGKEGKHLKILVTADISQPILRGTIVQMNRTTKWVSFKYKRCPDFCYNCGIIRHSERSCQSNKEIGQRQSQSQYGPRLRASNNRSSPQQDGEHNQSVWTPARQQWKVKDGDLVRGELPDNIEKQSYQKIIEKPVANNSDTDTDWEAYGNKRSKERKQWG